MTPPLAAAIEARCPGAVHVPGGASTTGGKGDALVMVDREEHRRRSTCGLGAMTSLPLLDVLLGLPFGEVVRWADLTDREMRCLRKTPAGIVDRNADGVRRLLKPPATVPLVVAHSESWSKGLVRASAFAPFAQRVLLLSHNRRIPEAKLSEADFWGVGVWRYTTGGIEELVPPEPWAQRYVKAAGWWFRERTYGSWLRMVTT